MRDAVIARRIAALSDRYRLDRELWADGMATVFKGSVFKGSESLNSSRGQSR